ncbi:hypothetical protein [Trinickia fusca]|uniref:Uncharacterized protein n=1 Tax=Trinickia fusca TaxID=2419777 RepID=A0A494XFH2_9BURK|nr:hypothetical protein [Trinickia fusca]RKP46844.1 hypothetical protein D7S89_15915 [Trinickia fusca]
MTDFLVRIELIHNPATPTEDDYKHLHQRMEAAGFNRTIVGSSNQKLALPPAEYFGSGVIDILNVRAIVVKAVSNGLRGGLSFRVFVAEVRTWASHNLAPAA